jgi:glycosyltransferase involved in cell wall biosynthesis/SAM-dependent methyltransferase
MNIYFLFYGHEPGITADKGGFRKLWELAERLQTLGHKVKIFFPRLPQQRALKKVPSFAYPVLNLWIFRPLTAYFSLFICALALGSKERPDIIYFRTSATILPLVLARCLRAKFVLELNATFRQFHKTVRTSLFRHFVFYITEKLNARHADAVISVTEGLKLMLIGEYKIPPEKIYVIPSATDIAHFHPTDVGEEKIKIGVSPDFRVIGFVGILYPHQGVDTLIRAAKDILKPYPATRFLIVGDGIMFKPWLKLAKELGLENSFIFTGQVPYDNVPAYFNAMDIFVAPFISGCQEPSPFKIFDALACAKVIIASDLAPLRMLSEELGGAVITVPADDPVALAKKIIEVFSGREQLEELGKAGRRIVEEKYSWEASAHKTADVLEGLLLKKMKAGLEHKEYYEVLSSAHQQLMDRLESSYEDYPKYLRCEYEAIKKKYYKIVLNIIKKEERAVILDIGCGPGQDLCYLAQRRRLSCLGIDLSLKHLKAACLKDFAGNRFAFLQAGAEDLPFLDAAFDIVISSEVIEHLPSAQSCIEEIYRVLRPGGRLVITTPNRYSYFALMGKVFPTGLRKILGRLIRGLPADADIEKAASAFKVKRHIHEFSPFELKGILIKQGFRVDKIEGGMLAIPLVFLFYKFPVLHRYWLCLDKALNFLPFSFYFKANFLIAAHKE